jgi:hypothetical protein
MHVIRAKYQNLGHEKRIYLLAILISLLFHLIFLLIFSPNLLVIDLSPEEKDLPEEVTIVFPENKPKFIVENINENNEIPDDSDLLSDYNSRARNEILSEQFSNQPMSNGNIPFANLTRPRIQQLLRDQFQTKKFTKEALIGKQTNNDQTDIFKKYTELNQERIYADEKTTNNLYEQKKFSADQVGDMSLSTYAWEWAPYINALKRKLYSVWFTPAAYHRLGLIYGHTVIQFQISGDGHLIGFEVLEHNGHESLEQSSINAINSVFPFKPLPANFPEKNLTITARLIYPNLRRRE